MNLLFPSALRAQDLPKLGGKARALAELGEYDFAIPAWFAVPPDADFTPAQIEQALAELGEGPYAVRSSGSMEDGAAHSFAGQFESHLDVPAAEVVERIGRVRQSARSEAVQRYCQERGLPQPGAPTVLIQRMIRPRCAGVAFSADPVSGRRATAIVSAVAGLGDALVSGECDGETWRVTRDGHTTAESEALVLDAKNAARIAALAVACEKAKGRPQDIEWALDHEDRLWLLQSRPITTLGQSPDPDDTLRVWDNSNIAESYGGVTTPLTFSFARRIYESAYREFCRLMSVPQARIERADDVFGQMLGLIRGRTYYNLTSWYRVLALLPGFRINRSFMEQMMGVSRPLPEEIVEAIVLENRGSRLGDALALIGTVLGLIRRHFTLPAQIRRFTQRFNQALHPPAVPLEAMSGEQLVAHYRDLERQLLRKWDAPLVNDFFAMIFYGLLRGLCAKWVKPEQPSLANGLLMDGGDIISAEPPRRIIRMARLAATVPGLPATLSDSALSPRARQQAIATHAELQQEFQRYLDDFGDRCLEELKLESPTVCDDSSSLLSAIGAMAQRPLGEDSPPAAATPLPRLGNPLKALVFRYVLRHARERVRNRENLRFERTRLFGRVRAILRELGKRLHADGRLDRERDVFHLELGEILAVWNATGTTADLAALARQRREQFARYEAEEAPPDRFTTRGPVERHTRFETEVEEVAGSDLIQGTAACPGVVTGRVRVVLNPRGAIIEPGEILVARQTDPGWVVLFPAAAGLLVERGSLLSHSAIVARELKLPCIVSLPGITQRLKTGDRVRMDGATGAITLLDS